MKVIDSALRKIERNEAENFKIHLVYAGLYYFHRADRLTSFILKGMKKYEIKSVMITFIDMWRLEIITKEAMDEFCKGKDYIKLSVNDDLESLLKDLLHGDEPSFFNRTYFLPKLTNEELELVEEKNSKFFETFMNVFPVVNEAEMELSESNSKYVHAWADRKTFTFNNDDTPRR